MTKDKENHPIKDGVGKFTIDGDGLLDALNMICEVLEADLKSCGDLFEVFDFSDGIILTLYKLLLGMGSIPFPAKYRHLTDVIEVAGSELTDAIFSSEDEEDCELCEEDCELRKSEDDSIKEMLLSLIDKLGELTEHISNM